jgi:hypothetical protein
MDWALIHPAEEFHAHIFEPVGVEIHRAKLAQGIDVNRGSYKGIVA